MSGLIILNQSIESCCSSSTTTNLKTTGKLQSPVCLTSGRFRWPTDEEAHNKRQNQRQRKRPARDVFSRCLLDQHGRWFSDGLPGPLDTWQTWLLETQVKLYWKIVIFCEQTILLFSTYNYNLDVKKSQVAIEIRQPGVAALCIWLHLRMAKWQRSSL